MSKPIYSVRTDFECIQVGSHTITTYTRRYGIDERGLWWKKSGDSWGRV